MKNRKIKVLIVSSEVWQNETNGGNVLTNLFSGIDAEFAQIYCSAGSPNNNVCNSYFQITDSMVIKNILTGQIIGNRISLPNDSSFFIKNVAVQENKKVYSFFRKFRWIGFNLIREILWKISKWNNKDLNKFITDFDPDVIFAPCYASHYMLRITRYIKSITNKNVVSYISDDHYSLQQWNFSILFWLNKYLLRKNLRRTFPNYSLVYTMTLEQQRELELALNANMKILRKGGNFKCTDDAKLVSDPIRMVFAGGIYCGRWKTLAYIGEVIKKINKNGKRIQLDIYTQNECSKHQRRLLNDGENIMLHQAINQTQLHDIYKLSDIALHVESFEKKYKLMTRLSFSTKIVDCLISGCAVMAISWEGHSGLKYLKREDAAFCISDLDLLEKQLLDIVNDPNLIQQYVYKANVCGKKNHQINDIKSSLYDDLVSYS